mmetsp:Transcript_31262/g.87785  ORF Transcript_31262/g.87785 Transcript_31262/m.87785 type:complete len:244 (-) Transcript_31262:203-934(-)
MKQFCDKEEEQQQQQEQEGNKRSRAGCGWGGSWLRWAPAALHPRGAGRRLGRCGGVGDQLLHHVLRGGRLVVEVVLFPHLLQGLQPHVHDALLRAGHVLQVVLELGLGGVQVLVKDLALLLRLLQPGPELLGLVLAPVERGPVRDLPVGRELDHAAGEGAAGGQGRGEVRDVGRVLGVRAVDEALDPLQLPLLRALRARDELVDRLVDLPVDIVCCLISFGNPALHSLLRLPPLTLLRQALLG